MNTVQYSTVQSVLNTLSKMFGQEFEDCSLSFLVLKKEGKNTKYTR